jgi:hypothetical protein
LGNNARRLFFLSDGTGAPFFSGIDAYFASKAACSITFTLWKT